MNVAEPRVADDFGDEVQEALITGIVVHWHNEFELSRLLQTWPEDDPRFALCVVDNGGTTSSLQKSHSTPTWLHPPSNLGFAGGINAGVRATDNSWSPWLLLLNPDTRVDLEALEQLAESAVNWHEQEPRLAMIAPRLINAEGSADQFGWQLRPLTKPRHLFAQCLFLSRPRGPRVEPANGALVEQPAAAALLVRRDALEQVGGFDERFFPAWFEDVDLAYRLRDGDFVGRYLRTAQVHHDGGASVPSLGFARFLRVYYRNLQNFARIRKWRILSSFAPWVVAAAAIARLPILLVRQPPASASRGAAAIALIQLSMAALSGWRWPRNSVEPTR